MANQSTAEDGLIDRRTMLRAGAAQGSDPRLSLQERYGNAAGTNAIYVASANALVASRFPLDQDVATYTTPAMSDTIPANP